MLLPGFWSGIVACVLMVIIVLGFSYGTGRTIEVGDIKIGAVPQVEDPDMKRCKAVQTSVENHVRIFADVKNALEVSMRATQEKEAELIKLRIEMYKNDPNDVTPRNMILDDIYHFRSRYSELNTDVNGKLDYIGEVLDYILRGCGLPARE